MERAIKETDPADAVSGKRETYMKLIIHDLARDIEPADTETRVLKADGKYAPCQGCVHCWTKNPATCDLKDSLQEVCRVIGTADDVTVITENWYGGYSPAVKNIMDRAIGTSTPFSTYRGGEMHHTLRYGMHESYKVIVYGDMTEAEEETWKLMTERNACNEGYRTHKFVRISSPEELEGIAL